MTRREVAKSRNLDKIRLGVKARVAPGSGALLRRLLFCFLGLAAALLVLLRFGDRLADDTAAAHGAAMAAAPAGVRRPLDFARGGGGAPAWDTRGRAGAHKAD